MLTFGSNSLVIPNMRLLQAMLLVAMCHAGWSAEPGWSEKSVKVDQLVQRNIKSDGPGAAIIVIKDGVVVHKKGYGLRNVKARQEFRPETVSMIGSMSKQFTAMAVMMLMEEGKVSASDPISKFLPEMKESGPRITVRHLLQHTGGLPDYEALMAGKLKIDLETGRRNGKGVEAREVVSALSDQMALRFEPGSKWEYSNFGYFLLSQIAERASGKSYADFLQERIFRPLAMTNTFVYESGRLRSTPNRAMRYLKEWYGTKSGDDSPMLGLLIGGGGVYSTAEDLVKWDAGLYTEKLVKSATLQQGFTPGQLNDGS